VTLGAGMMTMSNVDAEQPSVLSLLQDVSTKISKKDTAIDDLNDRLVAIESALGISSAKYGDVLGRIAAIKVSHPDNLAIKNFCVDYFNSLPPRKKEGLLKIASSGIENEDSGLGCYAMNPTDYDEYKPFMDAVIREYHKVPAGQNHINDWKLDGVQGLPADGRLDVTKLGLPALSMRVRVGRNLQDFPLPGAMTKEDRIAMETKLRIAFAKLIEDPRYGGKYNSLTPGSPDFIDDAEYKRLVKAHIMFKDMAADPYLATAGIASDWPYGRGCYVSADKGFIIWVGEEDHLRIMCMKKGTVINDVFDRLKEALDTVESIEGLSFAHSDEYGYVTSCPSNLGTGMRASVHIKIPKLTADGTETKAKAVCKPLGLSVRGVGGEHTAIGADGTCDISPSARFCISEAQIVTALYNGIKLLKAKEDTCP
jgi:creatine kinase